MANGGRIKVIEGRRDLAKRMCKQAAGSRQQTVT
jgi:hypothetical protein